MLAIAATSFDKPSETFLLDHVRTLAPGKTVVIAQAGGGAERLECPALVLPEPPLSALWRTASAVRKRLLSKPMAILPPALSERDLSATVSFLREHRPRALLAEFGPVGIAFAPAAGAAEVPLFVHFHGYDASALLRSRTILRGYQGIFRAAKAVIAPSAFLTQNLEHAGCPQEKLHVCACGIDPERFVPAAGRPFRVVAVGRLVEKKAPHLTIDAFAELARRFPEARLDMVGAGPLDGRCRRAIARHDLAGRVALHGAQPHEEVVRLMREASLFVQHSVTASDGDVEGMPVGVLEAMASALPVVSTRHSGIAEAVLHGETGLLVEERDVDAMAGGMAALLSDPERAAAMGRAGRARVLEHYTHEKARDRLRAIMGLSALPTDAAPSAATK